MTVLPVTREARAQRLRPTVVSRRYRGGALLARWRNEPAVDSLTPEDWVGSTTPAKDGGASGVEGLSELADGQLLRDAIASAPEWWLGARHVATWGADPAVLVKLLDSAQRLPVHAHPSREWAREHLGHRFGKSEAWIVVATRDDKPADAWVGMREPVDRAAVRSWIDEQRRDEMLAALNHVTLRAGDVLFVPGGVPHAIGAGMLVVELQEPTDWSLHIEIDGYSRRAGEEDPDAGLHTYGVGWDVALGSLELGRWTPDVSRLDADESSLPARAREYFDVGRAPFPRRFNAIIVVDGHGSIDGEPAARGDAFVLPAAAPAPALDGPLELVCCVGPGDDQDG